MSRFTNWFTGNNWAQPVVCRRWVPVASITEWIKRASHYKLCVHAHHRAWEKACGIPKLRYAALKGERYVFRGEDAIAVTDGYVTFKTDAVIEGARVEVPV